MPIVSYVPGRAFGVDGERGTERAGRFFSSFPTSTPKNALNLGPRPSENVETMARFVVDVNRGQMQRLLNTLPATVQAAARTLLFEGDLTADNSAANGIGFFDFLLTSWQDPKQEREQAVDTLSDNTVIFYSGMTAPVCSGAGTLLNTYQDDQDVWFQLLYAELLRGTMLARRGLVARFFVDSYMYTGYLTSLVTGRQGGVKNAKDFSFTFRVKQIQIATPIIYNPTTITSRIQNALFQADQRVGADDDSRRGAQTGTTPIAPAATPAAQAVTQAANVDPREIAVAQGQTAREAQAVTDAQIVAQSEQARAAGSTAIATATAQAPVAASGDVRQTLPAADARQIRTFNDADLQVFIRESLVEDAIAQINASFAADAGRGSVFTSPVTQGETRSSARSDMIARQPTTEVTADTRAGTPAAGPPTAPTAAGAYSDVYRVHDTSLSSVAAAQSSLSSATPTANAVQPRTRRRSTARTTL